jgi:hypothetical protein
MAGKKVPVTSRALIQRINRKLAADGEVLKASRGMQAFLDVGDHYVLDISMNAVVRKNLDIEQFGRSLGVLKPYEGLAD